MGSSAFASNSKFRRSAESMNSASMPASEAAVAEVAVSQEENRLLAALALAMVEHPRATLQELARAVGLSKATLYRFCRTREQLVERLLNYSVARVTAAIEAARLSEDAPLDALHRLTVHTLEQREFGVFLMMYYWQDGATEMGAETGWESHLDAFFLRGQQAGAFRIDVATPALTELWMAIFSGLIDAERRGRIARASLAGLIEQSFLQGSAA